jgi:hypothetical protein
MSKLTSSNANYLKSKLGINPSDADLYGAHFLGPQGYASIYKTSSNTPLSSILSQGVISANPFLSGKTTGYLKNWLSNKMGQGVSQASYDEYGVDTSLNLPMNTGEYQTAPDIASKEDLEAEQAKAELLQKQNEKNFIAEVQAQQDQDSQRRQQQEEQYQQYQQQDTGIDEAYYQMPQIALPEYIPPQQEQFQVGGFKYTVTGNNPIVIPPQGSYPLSYRDRGNIDTELMKMVNHLHVIKLLKIKLCGMLKNKRIVLDNKHLTFGKIMKKILNKDILFHKSIMNL